MRLSGAAIRSRREPARGRGRQPYGYSARDVAVRYDCSQQQDGTTDQGREMEPADVRLVERVDESAHLRL